MTKGRSSARETAARVAAGAIADKILLERTGCEVVSYVSSVGSITIPIEVTQSLSEKFSRLRLIIYDESYKSSKSS